MRPAAPLILLIAMAPATAALASERPYLGFSVGLTLPSGPWTHDVSSGFQGAFVAGYAFTPDFALQAELQVGDQPSKRHGSSHARTQGLGLLAQQAIGTWGGSRVFAEAGLGYSGLRWDQDVSQVVASQDQVHFNSRTAWTSGTQRRMAFHAGTGVDWTHRGVGYRASLRFSTASFPGTRTTTVTPTFSMLW